jgi:GTP cyclohydrolase I/GTP cyclohydrolase-4
MAADRSSLATVADVQAGRPDVEVSLSKVGVTGVEKVIRIRQNGVEQLFSARFECVVDLGPSQKGAHMSRFEETVNDVIGEVVLGETAFRAETLAEHIAQQVRERPSPRRCPASRPRSCTRSTAPRSHPKPALDG